MRKAFVFLPAIFVIAATASAKITIQSTQLPNGVVSKAYSTTLKAGGGSSPYTWKMNSCSGACNSGLAFSSSGTLSGTPGKAGTSTLAFSVTGAGGRSASTSLNLTIAAAPTPKPAPSPTPTPTPTPNPRRRPHRHPHLHQTLALLFTFRHRAATRIPARRLVLVPIRCTLSTTKLRRDIPCQLPREHIITAAARPNL